MRLISSHSLTLPSTSFFPPSCSFFKISSSGVASVRPSQTQGLDDGAKEVGLRVSLNPMEYFTEDGGEDEDPCPLVPLEYTTDDMHGPPGDRSHISLGRSIIDRQSLRLHTHQDLPGAGRRNGSFRGFLHPVRPCNGLSVASEACNQVRSQGQ